MSKIISARLDEKTVEKLERASKKSNLDKTSFLRIILTKGLEKMENEEALNLYKKGEVSLGKLSELLNKNYWDTLDFLQSENIFLNYSKEDFGEDIEYLKNK